MSALQAHATRDPRRDVPTHDKLPDIVLGTDPEFVPTAMTCSQPHPGRSRVPRQLDHVERRDRERDGTYRKAMTEVDFRVIRFEEFGVEGRVAERYHLKRLDFREF